MFAWRRFLGFLALEEPSALEAAPAERLTFERGAVPELDPAGKVDGHEGSDVGNRVSPSGDEFAVRQAGIHHREELAQTGPPAFGERGDLLVVVGHRTGPLKPGSNCGTLPRPRRTDTARAVAHAPEVAGMCMPGGLPAQPHLDRDAMGGEPRIALPRDLRIGILDGRDHCRLR
jgi:hypothetical protein